MPVRLPNELTAGGEEPPFRRLPWIPRDVSLSAVVVMRHEGIALAMQQSYWDKYGIGKAKHVLHPVTQEPTDRNPVAPVIGARRDTG
jgi:hypothetical protein